LAVFSDPTGAAAAQLAAARGALAAFILSRRNFAFASSSIALHSSRVSLVGVMPITKCRILATPGEPVHRHTHPFSEITCA
jgi:hypothetical protein